MVSLILTRNFHPEIRLKIYRLGVPNINCTYTYNFAVKCLANVLSHAILHQFLIHMKTTFSEFNGFLSRDILPFASFVPVSTIAHYRQ